MVLQFDLSFNRDGRVAEDLCAVLADVRNKSVFLKWAPVNSLTANMNRDAQGDAITPTSGPSANSPGVPSQSNTPNNARRRLLELK